MLPDDAAIFASPAACARETASALGLAATIDDMLADIDYGSWHGRRLADLAVDAQAALATAENAREDGLVRYEMGLANLQTLTGTL